ncbi:unnamed protein product, partial [Ixodes persulcatus]
IDGTLATALDHLESTELVVPDRNDSSSSPVDTASQLPADVVQQSCHGLQINDDMDPQVLECCRNSPSPLKIHMDKPMSTDLYHPNTQLVQKRNCSSPVNATARQLLLDMVPDSTPTVVSPEATATESQAQPNLPVAVTVVSGPSVATTEQLSLRGIQMPKRIKPRGRPAGSNMTVIGLSRKKRNPKAFADLETSERQRRVLAWLVGHKDAGCAVDKGIRLDENKVEMIPSRLPEAILDNQVDVDSVKRFFTADGWCAVSHVLEAKRKAMKWKCNACKDPLADAPSVVCEACLCWYHQCCQNMKPSALETAQAWFCKKCL